MTNKDDQRERREVLQNDKLDKSKSKEAATFFERAENEAGAELGGRFKHLSKTTITGTTPQPQVPNHPTWPREHSNLEPGLGYSVDSVPGMETVDGGSR